MLMGYSWKSCVLYPRPIEFLIICTKKTNKYLTFYWTSNLYSVTLICNSAGRTFSAKVGCFGCRVKANCSLVGPGHIEEVPSVGTFLRDPSPYLREFRRKTAENYEPLNRQARPGIEPGTSRTPALSTEELHYWWGFSAKEVYETKEK